MIARTLRNFSVFALGFATMLGGLSAANLAADPYADFFYLTRLRAPRVKTLDQFTDLRFKAALLDRAGRGGVDAAIFGSSRCMRIDPTDPALNAVAPRALNLAVQGARLGMTQQFVERFARRNPDGLVFVGVDFFAFIGGPLDRSIFLDEANPLPAWRESFWRLATCRTLPDSWAMLHGEKVTNELRPSGLAVKPAPNLEQVRAQLDRFAAEGWKQWPHFKNFRYDPARLDVLRAIRASAPRTVFFIPPVSRQFQRGQSAAGLDTAYAEWKRDLGHLGGVIDFSDAAAIVDEPRHYLDVHHTDTAAGALMLADLVAFTRGEALRHGRVLP